MPKYLKNFELHTEYESYINGNNKFLPNVSHCIDENDIHYNPSNDSRMTIIYTVTDNTGQTRLYNIIGNDVFDKIEIDGVEVSPSSIDSDGGGYQLSIGEHVVKYTFKNNVTSIDDSAFERSTEITTVIIPNNIITIDEYAFYQCENLVNLTIGNNVEEILDSAFGDCKRLKTVKIPASVTDISVPFKGCASLMFISVDADNQYYDSRDNCSAIIDSTTNILVQGCKNTIIPNTVTGIGSSAFQDCDGLIDIIIPDSVTTIQSYAFSHCKSLVNITIPNTVTTIYNHTFYSCSSLTNITLSDNITGIGDSAFSGCSSLQNITLPSTLTSLSSGAFGNCAVLNSITCLATTAPTAQSNTFYEVGTNGTLVVPLGSTGYDTWMGIGNYYLGKYGWTKVEQ